MIYLDNNASTPLDPFVQEMIKLEMTYLIDNPSSMHKYGQEAKKRLDKARRYIADYFKVKPTEIIFTSSGTEAMNFLIRSALHHKKGHIISSSAEHSAVYNLLKSLPFETTFLNPEPTGEIAPEKVFKAIRPDTILISLMAVNNETGVKTDIDAIAKGLKVPFIVDGVQWLGKEPISLPPQVTGIGFSGHKIHAPPGIGFAIIRHKQNPFIVGGAQEFGMRGGTENMLGIMGLYAAFQKLTPIESSARDLFEKRILDALPNAQVNGKNRVANVTNITFSGIDGETLLIKLDQKGLAASLGSACSSGAIEPSRVLIGMGLSYKLAKSSLRFSFSRMNTLGEAEKAAQIVIESVRN